MNFISKLTRLCSDRGMWRPYLRWAAARMCLRKPRVDLGHGASVGEWLRFSEFFSYHQGITAAELRFLQRVKADSHDGPCVAFDVGANVGLFSCAMIGAGFDRIHSFEPIPDTFVRLKRNVLHNHGAGVCVLNCMGVGAERGLVKFAENVRAPGVSRMATEATPFSYQVQQVPIISLDEYCSLYDINTIHLAKVDVEGMEELVLKGAGDLLKRRAIKRILIEVSPVNQPQVGLHIDGLLKVIADFGYRAHKLNGDGTVGEGYDNAFLRTCYQENVVLVPSE